MSAFWQGYLSGMGTAALGAGAYVLVLYLGFRELRRRTREWLRAGMP